MVQADLASFTGANAQVVGVSTDSIYCHRAFQASLGGLDIPLMADRWPYAEMAKSYQLFPASRHEVPFVADRAAVVVDKMGKIAWVKTYGIDELPNKAEILAEVRKLG